MSKDYTVRPYKPGDEEGIVQLLDLVFNGWPRLDLSYSPIEFWRWKYKDNPLKRNNIVVCTSEDKIIGCAHAIPLRMKVGKNVVLGVTGLDYAVHPKFRRRGIATELRKLHDSNDIRAGMKVKYAITGNPILIENFSKIIPRFPSLLVNLVRIRDIDKQLQAMKMDRAWIKKIGFHTAKLITDLRKVSPTSPDHDLHILETRHFDDRIDEFWNSISGRYNFILERRQDYLNWRYCDPRAGDFIVKQAEEDGKIVGYVAMRINRYLSEYPVGFIVDLLALPDRLDVVDALSADAIQYFDGNDVNIVNYQITENHQYRRVLERNGFIDSRIKIHLFCNPIGMKKEKLNEIINGPESKVFISWGDHDVLPVKMPSYT